MKITVEYKQTPRAVDGRNIAPGTVFRGEIAKSFVPSLYVRTYDQIVDLANPNCVWCMSERRTSFEIENYVEHDVEIIDRGPKQ